MGEVPTSTDRQAVRDVRCPRLLTYIQSVSDVSTSTDRHTRLVGEVPTSADRQSVGEVPTSTDRQSVGEVPTSTGIVCRCPVY